MPNWIINYLNSSYDDEIAYNEKLIRIGYLDMEVDSNGGYPVLELANKEITAISLAINDKVLVWGMRDFDPPSSNVTYYKFDYEIEMLRHFISVWERLSLDIVSGWNISGFDIPYLIRRILSVLGKEWASRLSPWGIIRPKKYMTYRGYEIDTYEIFGISDVDYLPAFKKFGYMSPEDYKLDTIAKLILDRSKVDYRTLGYKSLNDLYQRNPQLYFEYNVTDAVLVQDIEKKKNLIRLILNMAYSAKINFNDVFKQTHIWDSIIYGFLIKKGIVVPAVPKKKESGSIEGGFVKEVIAGIFKFVVSFDLRSLYPSIFMHYNIGVDTYRGRVDVNLDDLVEGKPHGYEEYLKKNNLALTANGTLYDRSKISFMNEIITIYFNKRDHFKKLMLKTKDEAEKETDKDAKEALKTQAGIYDVYQQNFKIGINAVYGASANEGFRFFDLLIAESITLSGQLTTKWVIKRLNKWLNDFLGTTDVDYIIAADTDSIYVNFEPLVNKMGMADKPIKEIINYLNEFSEKQVKPQLDSYFESLASYMNSYQQSFYMKREKITDKAIWTAKKRYIMRVWNNEGVSYEKPKIEVVGIETVRSTTPEFCKSRLKKSFEIIMDGDETKIHDYVKEVREEFFKQPFEAIATPKGVKGLSKYSDKNLIYSRSLSVPIHVRASLMFNWFVDKKGVGTIYEKIMEGEKIKYCYLKMPNPLHENVIATTGPLPEEFGLSEYIDYNQQFEKTFLEPLKTILHAIGWNHEKRDTLDDIFE